MKNFGIFFNPNYQDKKAVFELLKHLHENNNLHFFKAEEQREILPDFIHCLKKEKGVKPDCILVFGGDGTILKALNFSLNTKAPILGINLGKLGFLSESSLKELEKSIEELKKNKFKVQPRMLLNVILRRNNKVIFSSLALNDAVIYKGEAPKLIDVKITSNRRFVVETRCDGVIAASPTGSTAYSLSAGGPILSPIMDAIVVAPLNPHILSVRPMVFSAADTLGFTILNSEHEVLLQLDGQNKFKLRKGDKVLVTASSKKVDFIKLSNRTFYQILRKKLHMGKK